MGKSSHGEMAMFAAVIVVVACTSLRTASGLESELNIASGLEYISSLRSTQKQCPASALICPNKPDSEGAANCQQFEWTMGSAHRPETKTDVGVSDSIRV